MLDFVVKEVLIVCDHSFEEMDGSDDAAPAA